METGTELDGEEEDADHLTHCCLPLGLGADGLEEVLIQGGNISVNGQLVPDGESQLLPGKGQSAPPRLGLSRAAGD